MAILHFQLQELFFRDIFVAAQKDDIFQTELSKSERFYYHPIIINCYDILSYLNFYAPKSFISIHRNLSIPQSRLVIILNFLLSEGYLENRTPDRPLHRSSFRRLK